LASDLTTGEGL